MNSNRGSRLAYDWVVEYGNPDLIPKNHETYELVWALSCSGKPAFFEFLRQANQIADESARHALVQGPVTVFLVVCEKAAEILENIWPSLGEERKLFLEVEYDPEWPQELKQFIASQERQD